MDDVFTENGIKQTVADPEHVTPSHRGISHC